MDSQHLSENFKRRIVVLLFSLFCFVLYQIQVGILSGQTLSGASAHFTFNESSGDPENLADGSLAKILGGANRGVRG